jgi:hypothetical protein
VACQRCFSILPCFGNQDVGSDAGMSEQKRVARARSPASHGQVGPVKLTPELAKHQESSIARTTPIARTARPLMVQLSSSLSSNGTKSLEAANPSLSIMTGMRSNPIVMVDPLISLLDGDENGDFFKHESLSNTHFRFPIPFVADAPTIVKMTLETWKSNLGRVFTFLRSGLGFAWATTETTTRTDECVASRT